MELVKGGDLFDYILKANGGFLTEDLAVHIFTQLVRALGYVHKKGVVHRDLKPENIMIDVKTSTDKPMQRLQTLVIQSLLTMAIVLR